ncbi:MAG: hypothetical protein R3C19_08680 [Planctomycetaceae bacterium]
MTEHYPSPDKAPYAAVRLLAVIAAVVAVIAGVAGPLNAQTAVGGDLGPFTDRADVGAVKHVGGVAYSPQGQTFELSGSGSNMWAAEDQFQFVWKKLQGNFILTARGELVGEGVDPHRKFGWIIRTSLDTDSPYVDVAVHGDGLTSMQFRRSKGAKTEEVKSTITRPDVIQLERRDGRFTMSVARFGDLLTSEELTGVDLGDDVYVGLFVCSHNADVVEQARFSNVRITIPAPDDFRPYRDYIGSRLEVMDVETGTRRVVHTASDSLQAPNWTTDGGALIFNRNGKLYRFGLADRQVTDIATGKAARNNNDHVLSFDGQQLGISSHSADHDGRSMVYTLPATGGEPKLVTQNGPSYLHGWSPDGRYLIYTGERSGRFNIYRIPAAGGQEVPLTDTDALDDGSEYSPDGKHIYFNSTRSGRMQIWRMNADGSDPQQVTDDEFNNWFPHVSPDGQTIVFLSFSGDVEPTDHPFYRQVYLRSMPAGGGDARVVAYLYGGQGTINVPSWSPDSRQIAFVSNSAQ